MVKYPLTLKKQGWGGGISQSLAGRLPKLRIIYRVIIIVRVKVVLRRIVFGTNSNVSISPVEVILRVE